MCLLINCGIAFRTLSYEETCCAVWGRAGYYIIALSCYLMDFGVLVTYWVALGDLASPLAKVTFGVDDKTSVKLMLAIAMLFPCYLRNLGALPGWSYINYGLILFGLLSMLLLCFQPGTSAYNRDHLEPYGQPSKTDWHLVKNELWPSLGTLAFTFCTHDSVFMVYNTLHDGTCKRWSLVCKGTMWSTVLLALLTGLPVYLMLGEKTASDVTTNFPDVLLMRIVRGALAISIALTWIYLQQVSRKYLHSLVMPMVRRRALTLSESYHMSVRELVFFTSIQFAATLSLGVSMEDLRLPMALTGVFAQSLVAFIIPPCLLLTSVVRGYGNIGYSRLAQGYFCAVLLFGLTSCTLGVQSTLAARAT